jgi:hypothetical protein
VLQTCREPQAHLPGSAGSCLQGMSSASYGGVSSLEGSLERNDKVAAHTLAAWHMHGWNSSQGSK